MKTIIALLVVFLAATTINGITDEAFFYDSNGGQYMAIMSSGDVGDFGYNYIINAGRVAMEQKLNMSGTLWVPNILDNVTAIAKGISLVQNNYRVIISGTFSHGNAMQVLADLYKNCTFVQYASSNNVRPNLSSLSWLNPEFWWIIGVFAGAITQTDNVGFIHPGLKEGSIQSINAFYSGVMFANPNLKVYTMFTGAYIAVDRANGACQHLVNVRNVGALTGQQDDLTVPIYAMNSGLLAIGVTGYSLRQLYGELVGVSFVRDWASGLATYAPALNGTVMKKNVLASFLSLGQSPDTPSHLVNSTQWATLQKGLALLKQSNTTNAWSCGTWLSKFVQNTTTGCLINNTQLNSMLYPDIINEGYYVVPLTDYPFPSGTRIGIIVAAAILLAIPVALAIVVIILRNNREIQSGSPFFFLVMLAGCALIYIGVIMWPLDPSVDNCFSRIWLPSLGATVAISALITKNLRIYLLFFNPFKFRGERLAIKNFFPVVIIFVALNCIILAVYNGRGPSGVTVQQGTDGLGPYETRHICSTSSTGNSIMYALIVYHFFQLALGCLISFLLRNVTEPEYSERKAVGMAIYVSTFCLAIVAILIGVTNISNEQVIVFISVALLICNTGVLIIIFGSRLINIAVGEVIDPVAFATKSKSQSGASKSSGRSSDGGDSGVITGTTKAVVLTTEV